MTSSMARCSSCRYTVISAFISSFGLPIRPIARPGRTDGFFSPQIARSLSTGIYLRSAACQDRIARARGSEHEEFLEGQQDQDDHGSPEEKSSTPWYLQVDMPPKETSPLLKRQQLPALPSNPPPLLQSMLEHISVDLGLDDLTLFDLRDIDPPPALGAKLLMVLGTARSEKHLHVSADRLCKWLKRTHKLSPYADGLIGRGEFKLRLRRKAKRARLLSKVGSTETSNVDDGIRTGWICVNVGNVPDGCGLTIRKDLHDDYVGFGEDVEGANLVIQMLTQEKREELDLEGLWGKILRRHERKGVNISEGASSYLPGQEVGQPPFRQDLARSDSSFPFASLSKPSAQIKAYSTSATAWREKDGLQAPIHLLEHIEHAASPRSLTRSVLDGLSSTRSYESMPRNQNLSGAEKRVSKLQCLFDNVRTLPLEEAREMLAHTSSAFWTSFNEVYPLFPNITESECRLSVLCYAHEIGAANGKDAIVFMLREMEATFIEIPERVYKVALKAILRPESSTRGPRPLPALSQLSLYLVAKTLEHMSLRGHIIATEEIRSMLQVGVLQASDDFAGQFSLRKDALQRLRRLMGDLVQDPAPIDAESRVLHDCADAGDWDNFWDVWRSFARTMRPRPKELYLTMFRRVAQRGHQAETMQALRNWVPEMAYEEPPVAMDADIAKAIKTCLLVAEPNLAKIGARQDAFGEWAHMWRRCNRAILDDPGR